MLSGVRARRRLLVAGHSVLAAVLVAVLAACMSGPAGQATGAAAPGPDPGLQKFYDQKLSWGPCGDFATADTDREKYADPRFECAKLEVPLDYAKPSAH